MAPKGTSATMLRAKLPRASKKSQDYSNNGEGKRGAEEEEQSAPKPKKTKVDDTATGKTEKVTSSKNDSKNDEDSPPGEANTGNQPGVDGVEDHRIMLAIQKLQDSVNGLEASASACPCLLTSGAGTEAQLSSHGHGGGNCKPERPRPAKVLDAEELGYPTDVLDSIDTNPCVAWQRLYRYWSFNRLLEPCESF